MIEISTIKEHMKVRGSDGSLVGVVDRVEGEDTIKLTKNDSPDGRHHVISARLVERIDDEIHLSRPAGQVMKDWDPDGGKRPEQDQERAVLDWADRKR